MNYKDFFKHLQYTEEAKLLVEEYINEPVAYRIKAEPGWKLIALGPTEDKYEVEVDFIDVDEWVFFTSLHFSDLSRKDAIKRSLIASQMEQSMPRIPDSYSGKLKGFFDSIRGDFPKWNGVTFPSLMIGCIGPSDDVDLERVEAKAKEIWKTSRLRIEEEERAVKKVTDMFGGNDTLQSALGGLLAPKVDKSKLN